MYSLEESKTPRSTLTPTPTPMLSGRSGQRKTPVWQFFEYNDSTNTSTFKVEITSGESDGDPGPSRWLCGHVLAGKYPTNMKLH